MELRGDVAGSATLEWAEAGVWNSPAVGGDGRGRRKSPRGQCWAVLVFLLRC